ncbi:MAG: 50S ribosomal protein L29 [Bacteroidales bacterium]|nr:50S ribosomal protein L29 [Bacteroidales bacterium]
MKNEVIRELSTPELIERLDEEQAHLVKLRLSHQVSDIENPRKIRDYRKTIARIKTELKRRELAGELYPNNNEETVTTN